MNRPMMVKLIEGGRGRTLVRLGEREVSARSNSPAVPSSATSELGTDKLALAQDDVVGCSVM